MPASDQLSHESSAIPTNGHSTAHDLFVLTDEQILEIEPENEPATASSQRSAVPVASASLPAGSSTAARAERRQLEAGATQSQPNETPAAVQAATSHQSLVASHDSVEPPAWLAAQMKDPWSGEEARELWNGVQQARQEAAVYRSAIATPEDAKALKELYPGGVNEARAAADRARLLDQIDQAYFGAPGKPAEQTSASRAQLAAMMLREDPAAFREMVFAGLRALEETERGSGNSANASNLPRLAQVLAANRGDNGSAVGATLGSPAANAGAASTAVAATAPTINSVVGAQHAASASGTASANEAHVGAYSAFEKAANEDLERSVGGAIERTLEQALPSLKSSNEGAPVGARNFLPLHQRLAATIRQDVEAALKGDRQLSEQIAQILSARRFDNDTRSQVVRLIDERARQLVPGAAKRVLNEWTHTTLAAHRGNVSRADAASSRREVAPVHPGGASLPTGSSTAAQPGKSADANRSVTRSDSRRIDYRKLSDEQILEL
jgi:hypothetical protein